MNTGGNPGAVLASMSCRMLTVSSRTKTDTGRRTQVGMLTPDDASPLLRAQKERHGTAQERGYVVDLVMRDRLGYRDVALVTLGLG